jgi:pimeloyl-ACP methyl ester carboxylesterase
VIQGLGPFSVESIPCRPGRYVRIIDEFAHHGFVTMRVDKPGQGDSEGGPTHDMDFETELNGYGQTLMALKGLDFVDPDNVIIFGHSMGGMMGPKASTTPGRTTSIFASLPPRTWPRLGESSAAGQWRAGARPTSSQARRTTP